MHVKALRFVLRGSILTILNAGLEIQYVTSLKIEEELKMQCDVSHNNHGHLD